jgi:hypothetical protein
VSNGGDGADVDAAGRGPETPTESAEQLARASVATSETRDLASGRTCPNVRAVTSFAFT